MSFREAQVNFSRGELGAELYGRFDVDAWASGLKLARNVFVLKYGGISKRPGTHLVAEVLDASADNRIVPFQFSLTQTYALEMGQGYMSPCALGGRLIEEEVAISAITNTTPARIASAYHGLSVGDFYYIQGVRGSMGAYLNGRAWRVTSVFDAGNFAIEADTRDVGLFDGCDGGVTRVAAPVVPPAPVIPAPVVPESDPVIYGGGSGDFFGWGGGSYWVSF